MRWSVTDHIKHELVIYFDKGNLYRDRIIETAANFWKDCVDASWNEAAVLVVRGGSGHGEGLSSSSLTIAHDGAVESIDDFRNWLLGAILEDVFLRGVVKNLVEFEFPRLLLVVHDTFTSVLLDAHGDGLNPGGIIIGMKSLTFAC